MQKSSFTSSPVIVFHYDFFQHVNPKRKKTKKGKPQRVRHHSRAFSISRVLLRDQEFSISLSTVRSTGILGIDAEERCLTFKLSLSIFQQVRKLKNLRGMTINNYIQKRILNSCFSKDIKSFVFSIISYVDFILMYTFYIYIYIIFVMIQMYIIKIYSVLLCNIQLGT